MPAGERLTPIYSFVIPLFNEEAVLPILLSRMDRLLPMLDGPAEVIFVDDGSTDTCGIVAAGRAKDDPRYRYIALSRNFGHQIAITAGMAAASGDAVIIMDADLQDPPETCHDLIAKWREGYDIVYAQRLTRDGESAFKLVTAKLFYKVLRKLTAVDIPENVGDFRLVDRKAVDTFLAMPEHDRFVRGMFGWMGYRQAAVPFHRDERAAGSTQYSLKKMLRLACDGIVGFSDVPLRLALWAGAIVSFAALSYGFVVLVLALVTANTGFVHGWASTIVVLSFIAGVNLITTGIVGLYVGRIHSEVKRRPLYVVGRVEGFGADVPASLRTAGDERAAGPESVPADRAKLGGTGGSAGGAGRVLPVARRSVGSGTT